MSTIIRPVGSQAAVILPLPRSAISSETGVEVDDILVVRDANHEVIYEYPRPAHCPDMDFVDDDSLAAKDSLAIHRGNYEDPDKPAILDVNRVRRRRALLMIACCILLGIVVLTTVLTNMTDPGGDLEVTSSVEEVNNQQDISEAPTFAPATPSSSPVAPTSPPVSLSKSVLESLVSNSTALDDPTSPEGQAFAVVSSEDLDNPNDIVTRYSLLTAYYATGGNGWKNKDGWDSHSSNHCGWHGNSCDSLGIVTHTVLDDNNLIGSIPEDFCLLNNMKVLVLSANNLDGTFPSCISNMNDLVQLHVNGNSFSGDLPKGLHTLPYLSRLTLSNNRFTGSLSNLFDDVQLNDPVFPSLTTLNLDDNQLSGTVPDTDLAKLTELRAMTFHNNPKLSGSLTETCRSTRTILASADCKSVVCPCCNDGNDCLV